MTISPEDPVKDKKIEFLLRVKEIHLQLLETLDYYKINTLQKDQETLNAYLYEEIDKTIAKMNLTPGSPEDNKILSSSVFDEVTGFGPVETLLRDKTVTDIFINGPDEVYIETYGRIQKTSITFLNHEHILRLVHRVASKSGRHLDLGTPYFDSQLPDGSRIHAIIPPLAIDGIKVSIRKYSFQKLDLYSLVERGCLNEEMAKFLQICVKARFNIIICGGTGSGKTTLMNSLLASISKGERMITIEDTPELEPSHSHVVRLLTRLANPEGKGAVTQADLMINALRMRPDRVILGELRGAEAFNLLHAMNTGQDGTMTTLHASGTEEVISRLLNMILMARYTLSVESVRQQIAGALDLIIYVTRLVDGSRRLMTMSQVCSAEDGDIQINDIFRFEIEKITEEELKGKFVKCPIPISNRIANKLITVGLLNEYKDIISSS